MKKFLSLVLAAAMVFAMTACGGNDTSSSTPAAGGSSAAASGASGASGEKVKIGLSIAGLTMPYYVRMYDGFMAAAEKEATRSSSPTAAPTPSPPSRRSRT